MVHFIEATLFGLLWTCLGLLEEKKPEGNFQKVKEIMFVCTKNKAKD